MKKLYLYNTLSRKKEEFKPIKTSSRPSPSKGEGEKRVVSFYHCGPTVYWTQHIGNLRGMVCADLIRRVFEYNGYKFKHVRNYTDVGHLTGDNLGDADSGEDRMEKAAKREKLDPQKIAEKYIKEFEKDTKELNILEPTKKPRATKYIKEMIGMIEVLIKKDFAYTTDLAVYFDITKAKDYTRLSGQKLEDCISGAGKGDVSDSQKKCPSDFALWFFKAGKHKNALQFWPSPFKSSLVKNGEGFPGWHIECSAMSKKLLGDTIDIHMGGIEHAPVHHTNEIAQSESANGVEFTKYWLHNEHLLVNNKKMAKSEGTGFSLSEVKDKGFSPSALRYFFLQAHYRSKQNFTWEAMEAAESGLRHLKNQIRELGFYDSKGVYIKISGEKYINDNFKNKFLEVINDDFNIPQALAIVQDLLKSDLTKNEKLSTIKDFNKVLGLGLDKPKQKRGLPVEIKNLIKSRKKARQEKNFKESDKLRDKIEKFGYIIEDTKDGMRIFKK
ncbi:cysteine--tRNA ligase [Candidatus Falkowbacteria bacterium CG11_big_fil_rev_8_21_14_0_20_39_10]|uniref:Cysteine--tRNA ligase n=1 Tax=Candidatus Falkowbacteria bacterium CG11_big_fil_rev_8_21_14_0_20_39_10 TaxID=1974570 RepID=A0A2M6K9P7_9BACT|nr:MAG: cysteine--tRNA ligase [Candidatus Falkowbacteria bacterium CG11_big_fil_rev_8_21_14_0_20_39_10]